ncbi:hypothetical protein [Piscibacillus salipiscarius]|uniref:Uncharacterized protein n=1 Tax=Piscibacillus salipiscarius TaxID=299480 RepID=A0ABW5Q9X0_9BACI|nr:hypothetical protein [Piscibacillus salipiscarius]
MGFKFRIFCLIRIVIILKYYTQIYRDLSIQDEWLLYSEFDSDTFEPVIGERIYHRELAKKYGLTYSKEYSSAEIARKLGGYPRYLILGEEGSLDEKSCYELTSVLMPFTDQGQCHFYYDILKLVNEVPDLQDYKDGLLYNGLLSNVLKVYNSGNRAGLGSPTYLWDNERSWCLYTDYDSDFSILGGNEKLAMKLLNNPTLECIQIDLNTRVDVEEAQE